MTKIKTQMGISEWFDLPGLAFLWGVSFFVIAIAVNELEPLTIVALRVAIALLIPVTAVLLGVVFLGESFGWTHFFGMLLIALGLGIVDGRLWSYLQMRFNPASL